MERFTCREDKVSVGGALAERACSVWTLTAGTLATAGIRLQVLPEQGFKSCGLRVGKELLAAGGARLGPGTGRTECVWYMLAFSHTQSSAGPLFYVSGAPGGDVKAWKTMYTAWHCHGLSLDGYGGRYGRFLRIHRRNAGDCSGR